MNKNRNIRSINQPENYPKTDALIELNSTQELEDHVACFCVEKKSPLCYVNAECKMLNNYSTPNKRQLHVSKSKFLQDSEGNNSSSRLLSTLSAIVALLLALLAITINKIDPITTLPIVIALLSFSAGHKSLNTYLENQVTR